MIFLTKNEIDYFNEHLSIVADVVQDCVEMINDRYTGYDVEDIRQMACMEFMNLILDKRNTSPPYYQMTDDEIRFKVYFKIKDKICKEVFMNNMNTEIVRLSDCINVPIRDYSCEYELWDIVKVIFKKLGKKKERIITDIIFNGVSIEELAKKEKCSKNKIAMILSEFKGMFIYHYNNT